MPVRFVTRSISLRFAAPPQRIVSLNTGPTETVFALGAGDRLVAVDSYSADQPVQPRDHDPGDRHAGPRAARRGA